MGLPIVKASLGDSIIFPRFIAKIFIFPAAEKMVLKFR
jgi:hypothetical protein